jgi:rhodanese-related sulfurtransferase
MSRQVREISTRELLDLMADRKGLFLIDVQGDEQFHRGHIPSSLHVPIEDEGFIGRVTEVVGDSARPVVIYDSGRQSSASRQAARKLVDAGFPWILHFPGGIEAWESSSLPVEQSNGARRR